MNIYDVCIIGAGVAGLFAGIKIVDLNKSTKTLMIDVGRPQGKRRRQTDGWFGSLPNSDAKFYLSDSRKLESLIGKEKTNESEQFLIKFLKENVIPEENTLDIVKDVGPAINMSKKLNKFGYETILNNYIQLYPKNIHSLSKIISKHLLKNNFTYSFDNEVFSISKSDGVYSVNTQKGTFLAKKLLLSTGRYGWRWAHQTFFDLGLIEDNNIAKLGVKIEMKATTLKGFAKSTCSLVKDNIEIGPINWNGTVIPEDHIDMAITAFRSNESRWESDKVSFNLIASTSHKNKGCEEANRLAKLIFLIGNDRVFKEKISTFLTNKSKISIFKEYNWLKDTLKDIENIIPDIKAANFHVPTIIPHSGKINVSNTMETNMKNLYVAGESSGAVGLYYAAISGISVAEGLVNG